MKENERGIFETSIIYRPVDRGCENMYEPYKPWTLNRFIAHMPNRHVGVYIYLVIVLVSIDIIISVVLLILILLLVISNDKFLTEEVRGVQSNPLKFAHSGISHLSLQ